MAELLLELLSEEVPARMQARATAELKRQVCERLTAAGLAFDSATSYVTPRRLALVVDGLPLKQADVTEEKKGPKLGAPEQATAGFLRANGLASLDQAELRETAKGQFYFAVRQIAGRASGEVLPELLAEAIKALSWPKSMRWAEAPFRWVRPLHGVLALFDGVALEGGIDLGRGATLAFGRTTCGHRFLAPAPFEVASAADYRESLLAAKVMVDQDARRASIAEQCEALAAEAGLGVKPDPGLLDEVTGLVEWPVALIGRIDAEFMALPPEVLTTSMRSHQKYFSLFDAEGRLAGHFLVVANMEAPAGSAIRANIVAGNERVLRARLADAKFFWDQDRKRSLQSRVGDLKQIVFHKKLGSVEDKVDRVTALAVELARSIPGADKDRVRSAARLCKADLTSGMVGEFPELQGVMGRYYALHDGEHEEVAAAIAEHYAPQGPNDRCPSAPAAIAVALADKIDTLVGMFAIDEKPTGSKDPYALRRAALGVIRLIVENELRLPLARVFEAARALHHGIDGAEVTTPLLEFFAERLKVALREKGVRHDLITAVFARGGEDDLLRLLARVEALESFLASDDGANLLVAYRRAANIVRIEAKKDKRRYDGDLQGDLLVQDEEWRLSEDLGAAVAGVDSAVAAEDFTGAMQAIARLRQPVDAFFDHVTVNAEDPALRENRLKLLARIGATLGQVADFAKIEG
jgi:glycyl-tRNA synthetase beta chain